MDPSLHFVLLRMTGCHMAELGSRETVNLALIFGTVVSGGALAAQPKCIGSSLRGFATPLRMTGVSQWTASRPECAGAVLRVANYPL
jgi:hypothetical protein